MYEAASGTFAGSRQQRVARLAAEFHDHNLADGSNPVEVGLPEVFGAPKYFDVHSRSPRCRYRFSIAGVHGPGNGIGIRECGAWPGHGLNRGCVARSCFRHSAHHGTVSPAGVYVGPWFERYGAAARTRDRSTTRKFAALQTRARPPEPLAFGIS